MAMSYSQGDNAPLLDFTIPQSLQQTAEAFPDNEALVERSTGRRWTYRQFRHQVEPLQHRSIAMVCPAVIESACGHRTGPNGR